MIDPRKIGQFLMGEWDKTSQPLKERASVLPLGQYEDGSVGMAWPGLLAAPAEGVKNFGTYGYGEDAVPYNSRMAFDAAGGAMTGGLGVGLAGGMVDNALGSAGGKLTLQRTEPMSNPAVRLSQIFRGEEPIGYVRYGVDGDAANILDIKTYDGSNTLGLSGIRELREAFREIAPEVKTFQGVREPTLKTGAARQGADASGYGERKQSVDLYSNAPTGSSVPMAMNALERSASDLPMDLASRMARAKEMGFDTDQVSYHGTPDSRDIWQNGFQTLNQRYGKDDPNAVYFFADEKRVADTYADDRRAFDYQNAEPETIPVHLRMDNPAVIDWGGRKFRGKEQNEQGYNIHDLIDQARAAGNDGFVINNVVDTYNATGKPSTIRGVFEPNRIRSVNAAFDPAKSDSANLLAANAPSGAAIAIGMEGQEQDPALIEYLKAIGLY